jgi:hypothetical protein
VGPEACATARLDPDVGLVLEGPDPYAESGGSTRYYWHWPAGKVQDGPDYDWHESDDQGT